MTPGTAFDVAEAKTWTDATVAQISRGIAASMDQGVSGHLDDSTSQNRLDRITNLPAGEYSYFFVCRGGGEVTLAITSGEVVSPTLAGPCTGQVQGGDFTASNGGVEFQVTATGAPVDYVVRFGTRIGS